MGDSTPWDNSWLRPGSLLTPYIRTPGAHHPPGGSLDLVERARSGQFTPSVILDLQFWCAACTKTGDLAISSFGALPAPQRSKSGDLV